MLNILNRLNGLLRCLNRSFIDVRLNGTIKRVNLMKKNNQRKRKQKRFTCWLTGVGGFASIVAGRLTGTVCTCSFYNYE